MYAIIYYFEARSLLHYARTVCIFRACLSLALQFYDGLPCDACQVIATDFSVPTYAYDYIGSRRREPGRPTLKPQGKIEFSVGGLALVSFFAESGRLSSDFHGGILQPCFFM